MSRLMDCLHRHLIVVAIFLLTLKTIMVTLFGFELTMHNGLDWVLLVISPIGTLMVFFSFSFFIKKRFQPIGFFVTYLLVTGLLYANLLYYRFYIDFVTFSVFLQLDNVGGLGASTVELMSLFDVFIFLDIIFIWYLMLSRRGMNMKMPRKKQYGMISIAMIVLTIFLGVMQNQHLFETEYNRQALVKSLGLYNYQMANMIFGIMAPIEKVFSTKADAEEISSFLQKEDQNETDTFGIARGKNIVLISMESLQQFVIQREVNGEEIAPFLNKLIKESYYFPNIYDQTAQGKTSDAELMVDTGLYPLSSGSVFVRHPQNHFVSLQNILQEDGNYQSYVFHGNDATFWNRNGIYPNLGYEHFYAKESYDVTEENSINYGIKDIPFFEQSMTYVTDLPEPFLAKFITLTNHFPFLLDEADQLLDEAETEEDVVNRYVTTVRYMDAAIERFFALLKEKNIYEHTIFVLYGDHYGISKKYEAGVHEFLGQAYTPLNHLQLQRIPLIIHIPGQEGKVVETLGGEIDIHATLLHLLGISQENHMNFSQNLFARSENHPVIFRDGSMIVKDYAYMDNVCYDRKTDKMTDDTKCEPYLEIVRQELKMSDDIILGDLLQYLK